VSAMSRLARRRLIFLIGIGTALGALGWLTLAVPPVPVVAVGRGPAVRAVYATGTVEATVMIQVAPRISARLLELRVDEGAVIRPGEVLARLDDAAERAALLEAEVQVQQYEQELERVARLVQRKAVSEDEFDKARSRLDVARATLRGAEARLGWMTLTAPSAGRVIRRDGEVGDMIAVNHPLLWLAEEGPLRITAEVDEEDISQVEVGGRVLIRADAFPGEVFSGSVIQVTPKGDPIARSYRVRTTVPPESPLRIGMTAETNIISREVADALLVPATAVQGTVPRDALSAQAMVWVVAEGRAARREVTIGIRGEEMVEVITGLSEGDLVVVSPGAGLADGQRVRARAAP